MKIKSIALCLIVATLPCVANAGGGKVFFSGSVMKSTYTLGSDDESKTLQLKTFNPSTPPKVGDAAAPTKFTITLSDCPSTMKTASIIFDSQTPSQNTDLLQLHGDNKGSNVSGFGIAIYEADINKLIPVGSASKAHKFSTTSKTKFHFASKVVVYSDTVKTDDFKAAANFTVSYN